MSDGISDNRENVAAMPMAATPAATMPDDDLAAQRLAEWRGQQIMSARLALRRGQRGEAKKLLAQMLKADPTDIAALELLGDIFLEDAEQEKAIQVFEHGCRCHPDYPPFEEKLAQAHLDIAEMERDKLIRQQVIELGHEATLDRLLDKKPALALGLSVITPGAGQFYNDQWEKAAVFFTLALATLCGWFYPLMTEMHKVMKISRTPQVSDAIDAMSSGERVLFYLMLIAWLAVYAASAFDAALSATRFNEERRRHLGL